MAVSRDLNFVGQAEYAKDWRVSDWQEEKVKGRNFFDGRLEGA